MGDQINNLLKSIYYNSSNPGSFGGSEKLFNEAIKVNLIIERKDVLNWLKKQLVYTLHKPVRHRFKRNPVISERINENFQADLVDLQQFSSINNGYKYILTCIDVLTKKAYAIPLKDKGQSSVSLAMESIIKSSCPIKLMTDKGKEFANQTFKALMKKYNINHFFSENKEIKCSIVERFNKTLKNKMFKYFTLKGKTKYIDELQNFLISYNNSKHRSIKMAPNEVTKSNENQVFKNLYGFNNKRDYLRNLKRNGNLYPGDYVRKKYVYNVHDRGFYPNWTDELFKIHKRLKGRNKPQYFIRDNRGNILKKKFYPEEIQKVLDQPYRIEKIIRSRKRNGIKEYFVKWLNYPSSENSWIPADNLSDING